MNIDKTFPVLVTGATGYVAGWIVKQLLENGVTIHAPIRDPKNSEKLKYLNQLAEDLPGSIKYFKADLLDKGSYEEAMQGCSIVFHTASPFITDVKDPLRDLVDPALLGTKNVLEEAKKTSTVKRVVLTSSCAAIYSDNADLKRTPDGVFTEKFWNTTSSLKHQPYSYSKTLAEKAAWKISESQKQWDLVVMNPSLVLGPGINPFATSESFKIIKQMGDGTMKSGIPKYGFGIVDVRDLADAHIKAAYIMEANGRYIVSGHNSDLSEVANILHGKYGYQYPVPKKILPKWLIWLVGPMINKSMTRKIISLNVNLPWKGDNSRGINELDLSYRPLKETVNDFFDQLIQSEQIKSVR